MTNMPKRPKRPADVIGNAVRVAQIAPGVVEEVVKLRLQGRLYRWGTISREGHTFRRRGSYDPLLQEQLRELEARQPQQPSGVQYYLATRASPRLFTCQITTW
jgi:hypothetical protein